jgi:hypothetical protein
MKLLASAADAHAGSLRSPSIFIGNEVFTALKLQGEGCALAKVVANNNNPNNIIDLDLPVLLKMRTGGIRFNWGARCVFFKKLDQ